MTTLSILIPSYNYDCSTLIRNISLQLSAGDELIVADDGSTNIDLKEKNKKTCQEVSGRFIDMKHNTGRSAIRNLLAREAKSEWILFIDNDAAVEDIHFIEVYRAHQQKADVLCGGTKAPQQCPSPNVTLRWRYEKDYWEKHSADVRTRLPYKSFTTFNFMIRRTIFLSILFREDIKDYGHEDTLFGEDLKRKDIPIAHIDCPLTHMGLDTNADYLKKVEFALDNLHAQREILTNTYSIIKISEKLQIMHLDEPIRFLYKITRSLLRYNLLGRHPNLRVLQFYKLGYFLSK